MKTSILPVLLTCSVFLVSCSNVSTGTNTTPSTNTTNTTDSLPVQPDRKVDIYGKVVSLEGNEVRILQVDTSKDPTFNMTPSEKQKYMQSMDESARMALKEQINNATLGEAQVLIPVGIPMIKKTAQGPDAPNVEASLADLKVGQFLSVWLSADGTESKRAEFVKIAFTQ
ncbi:hypothetical protein KBD33_02615 [Candidatus Gracilibacteria bacterium]|nr:hypothetical protein [Candidatus Gracilibacteria bacterium]